MPQFCLQFYRFQLPRVRLCCQFCERLVKCGDFLSQHLRSGKGFFSLVHEVAHTVPFSYRPSTAQEPAELQKVEVPAWVGAVHAKSLLRLLCQTREKFITDYEVFEERKADCELTEMVIDRHEAVFGETPEVLAGDKGFCPEAKKYEELEERVGTLAIPRRMRDFADAMMGAWQAFRAGIEGTISGLKRAFRLARCYFRGFNSFESAIGLGVFSHNLIVLAKLKGT